MSYCFKTSLHPPQTARVSVCCQNPNKQICINLSPCHYSCSVKIVSRLPTRCFVMDSSVKSVCLIQRGEILVGHFGHDHRFHLGLDVSRVNIPIIVTWSYLWHFTFSYITLISNIILVLSCVCSIPTFPHKYLHTLPFLITILCLTWLSSCRMIIKTFLDIHFLSDDIIMRS